MFAVGLAISLGISVEAVRAALVDFRSSPEQTPGRLNVFEGLPFKVVVDYAHNGHGLRTLCDFLRAWPVTGKRTLIVLAQERHRAVDRRAIADAVAAEFDRFICRDPNKLHQTEPGEVAASLRDALLDAGASPGAVEVIPELEQAVSSALLSAQPGDLVVVCATGRYQQVWKQLTAFREQALGAPLGAAEA
jgi:cyanophycin synthetase